jgi:methionine-rich copper-binding protein CopC
VRLAGARALIAGMLGLGLATAAPAHPHLVAAAPAPNSIVVRPARIALRFSERLIPRFCRVEILDGAGRPQAMATAATGDGLGLVLTPPRPLAPGAYRVNWRAVSVDTHRLEGSYSFEVR